MTMTKTEALELLVTAPRGDVVSKLNPSFSQKEMVEIVEGAVQVQDRKMLVSWLEKRVWQAVKNQRRPRY